MRNPTDKCLLCKTNFATKTNSHIFPKFLSKDFLGANGVRKRGFELNSEKLINDNHKVIQDSPKENYILCDECEAYFGVLERIASYTFINWRNKVENGEYSIIHIINELQIVDCKTADKKTIQLFIYSIFWRASISNLEFFENFNIEKDFEEELRLLLMKLKRIRQTDYLDNLSIMDVVTHFPTSIITAASFNEETANILYAPFTSDPYCLVIDKFVFMLFHDSINFKTQYPKEFNNLSYNDCKIMVFSEPFFIDTILKRPKEQLAVKAREIKKL